MAVIESSPEEQIHHSASRILRHLASAFAQWWSEFDAFERERLLAFAIEKSPAIGPSEAAQLRDGTEDPVPICHFIEVVGTQKNLLPEDANSVRTYRNDLIHRKKQGGTLLYLQPSRVTRFMLAAARLAEGFRAHREHSAIADLDAHIRSLLGASVVAEPAAAPAPRPPRIEEPPFPMPKPTASARKRVSPNDAATETMLSADQRAAVERVLDWFHGRPGPADGLNYFALAGPAGSGKTTVTGLIVKRLNLQPQQVALLAPTGKAVEALKPKLPTGWKSRARTLASFLWKWQFKGFEGEDNQFINQGAKPVEPDIRLVIVDEASMVTGHDLKALSRYRHVLFTGDPDQLPPVVEVGDGDENAGSSNVLEAPHARLEVVHRQEVGSSIRTVAEAARAGQAPALGPSADGRVLHLSEEFGHFGSEQINELFDQADVILTQRNSTRVMLNEYVRRRRGFMKSPIDFAPKPGEIVVSSENFMHPVKKIRIANGERFVIQSVLHTVSKRPDAPEILDFVVVGHPEGRDSEVAEWTLSSQMLAGDQIRGSVLVTGHVSGPRSNVLRADWGYALTVHKAQGSEWSKVVVVDDMNPDHKIPQNKWYYVAYSRAVDQLVILKVKRDTLLFAPGLARG